MKNPAVVFPFLIISALFALGVYFGPAKGSAYAQAGREQRSFVSKTSRTSRAAGRTDAAVAAKYSGAATRNSTLRSNLSWTFGGKRQTGWNIYVPLISDTIGTDDPPASPHFAAALAAWQGDQGLLPNGVLDNPTLQAFITYWQGRRLGRSGSPHDERLLSAPIVDFFDPTRNSDLLKLERETYTAYRRMIAAASTDLGKLVRFTKTGELAEGEKFLRIVSAYRSPAYQAALRRKEPNAGRGALAKFSAHATGQALDLYVGGEAVSTKDHNRLVQVETPAYKWLVKNAHRFGFYPYFYEPWHWEYVPGR